MKGYGPTERSRTETKLWEHFLLGIRVEVKKLTKKRGRKKRQCRKEYSVREA